MKRSAWVVLAIGLLICLMVSSAPAKANNGLLVNGGFEWGNGLPDNWLPDSWIPEAAFTWSDTQSYLGSKSIQISLTTANDARWIQTVNVQPDTDYRLSGWIKTENVAHTSETADVGASLGVYSMGTHTLGLLGTNEWTHVSLVFNTGSNSQITIAARLGYWSGTTTGTAWFDELSLASVEPNPSLTTFLPIVYCTSCESRTSPGWKILVLVYESTDFAYVDDVGQQRHFIAQMTQADKDKLAAAATRFVNVDVPALNSGYMTPTLTIRYLPHALTELSLMSDNRYAPSPTDAAPDRDPAFDSVITIWDGSGTDLITDEPLSIKGSAWAWPMGIGQTYDAIHVDFIQHTDRNVFKHEWGHSILFYYDSAGTAPYPAVDNHINDTTHRYVTCVTGESYILQDETDLNPIPHSIYNNLSGFTHDYYSGFTATADRPMRCLGITAAAWASGGPVSRPPSGAEDAAGRWRSPRDDTIAIAVPYPE
ncbi:MAG: hypothetical protein JXA89_20670 [Anaerolineae bacterium]|nr:hypothetical protein [Anaerolineae bacterium]